STSCASASRTPILYCRRAASSGPLGMPGGHSRSAQTTPTGREGRPGMVAAYTLAAFTGDLDEIAAAYPHDRRTLLCQAQRLLASNLGRLLPEANGRLERFDRRLLYRHAANAYTVWVMEFPPGGQTPVHDHRAWGLVGVGQGEEHEERFQRVDDRSRLDYAE